MSSPSTGPIHDALLGQVDQRAIRLLGTHRKARLRELARLVAHSWTWPLLPPPRATGPSGISRDQAVAISTQVGAAKLTKRGAFEPLERQPLGGVAYVNHLERFGTQIESSTMECAPDAPRENKVSQEGQLLDEIARIRLKNHCKRNMLE